VGSEDKAINVPQLSNPDLQSELMETISNFASNGKFDRKGIEIYQRNLLASATRSLANSYPTVNALLGDDLLNVLTRDFLIAHPKSQYDWAQWGSEFPQWLAFHPVSTDAIYLVDCAKLDWIIHMSSKAEDNNIDLNSLLLLESHDLNDLQLTYNPSVNVFYSDYPIVDIYIAHDKDKVNPDLSEAKYKLSSGLGQTSLICRQDWKTAVREVKTKERCWLVSSVHEISIMEVLNNSSDTLPLETWLPQAIQESLFLKIELIQY